MRIFGPEGEEMINACKILVARPEGKTPL